MRDAFSLHAGVKFYLRDYVINWPCECARIGMGTVSAWLFTTTVLKGGSALRGKK